MTYVTTTAPYVQFSGPEGGILYQKTPSGQRSPRFSVDKSSSKAQRIDRIMPNGSRAQFATASTSFSGKTKISVGGAQVTLEPSWEGLQYRVNVKGTPMGDLKWTPSSSFGHEMKLEDARGATLAEYKTKSRSGRELPLDIFLQGDDALVDLIIASAVSLNGKIT